MITYTKETLTQKLLEIADNGWVPTSRSGNAGGVGNTLEYLLGIKENNLPLPNANEWELKAQRVNTVSLTTMLHMEPSPRAMRFVPNILLPLYGWKHAEAGSKYPETEMSFRQTISCKRSDRGFCLQIDDINKKIEVSFDSDTVSPLHADWLKSVSKRAGLAELSTKPYWGYNDLASKAHTKMLNCFFVRAESKKEKGLELFKYTQIYQCQDFSFEGFLHLLRDGDILVDFDARTGHNHGTKFRIRQDKLRLLYGDVKTILE